MKYVEFKPIPELAEYIQLVWMMESEKDDDIFPREQIMPDGIVEIIFHYGDPYITYRGGSEFLQPQCFAISMMRHCVEIESAGRTGFVSVRFFPWGGYHFFKKPIADFLDQTISSEELWEGSTDSLLADLRSAKEAEEKVGLVQQFLLAHLHANKRNEPNVDEAVKLIRHSHGQLSIEEICEQTGFSKKQLERKFLASAGTTPKIFSRVSRFLFICHHLKENNGKTLTELAYECGFYDQAHFIKEFKDFSGFTPKEFFTRNNVVFADL